MYTLSTVRKVLTRNLPTRHHSLVGIIDRGDDMTDNKYWIYLENLRRSGAVNMFGSAPYLKDEFNLTDNDACKIVSDWMNNYNPNDYK